jgi:hypothetical protein
MHGKAELRSHHGKRFIEVGRRIAPIALAALGAVAAAGSQQPSTSTRAVAGAAAAYVAEYQRQLTSIVAEETYTQEIVEQTPPDPDMPRTRTLRGEVFFMFAAATREWMAIRDVFAVDGEPVAARPDLPEALRSLPPREVAATFKAYNSRFNLGRTFRNFNEPTLGLLVLDEEHRRRFSFDRRRVERTDSDVLVTLAFREREAPTLIRDMQRGRVFSSGELLVEAGTGRVRRTVLTAALPGVQLRLTTTYAPDSRLGMWVPATFHESYTYGARRGEHEAVMCEATYTNYRRFETSARVK